MPVSSDGIEYKFKYEDCEHEFLTLLVDPGKYTWYCPDCGWEKQYAQEERKD